MLTSPLRVVGLSLVLSMLVLFSFCQISNERTENIADQSLKVNKAHSEIIIDGIPSESAWQRCVAYTFDNFYKTENPDDQQETSFKMLWDDTHLYFLWECKDKFITAREKERDRQPYFDDCAEIFLIPTSEKIKMHFGYEVNLYSASNDFIYINDIYGDEDFVVKAYNPEFQVASTFDGTINNNSDTDKGWKMEIAIPMEVFNTDGPVTEIKAGAKWAFMAIRQDRNDANGNRRSKSTIFPLSSKDQNVHNPENFGVMEFID